MEAERVKASAIQEAAYYRAKAAALEASAGSDLARLERDRAAQLERQISSMMADQDSRDKELAELSGALELKEELHEQAEARAAEAIRRAERLEELHQRVTRDHEDLRGKHATIESALREHENRAVNLNSQLEQKEAERSSAHEQLEDLLRSRDQHVRALDQARTALDAASHRAEEVDAQFQRSREQVIQLETDMAELRVELDARNSELASTRTRLAETEDYWAKSREEADAFRALTSGSLGELLDSHKDLRADEDRLTRGHIEKIQAMEVEADSLRNMVKDTENRLEVLQSELAEERQQKRLGEAEALSVGAQLLGVRAQLTAAISESGRLRKDLAAKDAECALKSAEASDASTRLLMLRNYLAENGLVVDENDIGTDSTGARIIELQDQLMERTRMQEDTERELDLVARQKQEAEAQVDTLSAQLDRLRSTQSPAMRRGADNNAEERAAEAERRLEETEQGYKARMQQLEEDYQLAVHYVKYVVTSSITYRQLTS
jgi:chromosome segregation ATPase